MGRSASWPSTCTVAGRLRRAGGASGSGFSGAAPAVRRLVRRRGAAHAAGSDVAEATGTALKPGSSRVPPVASPIRVLDRAQRDRPVDANAPAGCWTLAHDAPVAVEEQEPSTARAVALAEVVEPAGL